MGNNNLDETSGNEPKREPKPGTFSLSPEPVVFSAEEDAHKYEVAVGANSPGDERFDDLGDLPTTYHEDTLFIVARDPRWLFGYWDFDWAHYPASGMRGGIAQFFLKILTTAGIEETLVEIRPEARNWYVPVSQPETTYYAEIGFFLPSGEWRTIVKSGGTMTPGEALASSDAADFATVPAHLTFERMLELLQEHMAEGEGLISALSRIAGEGQLQFRAGQPPTWTDEQKRLLAALLGDALTDQLALGSEEIDQLLRKQLQQRLHSESASLSFAAGGFLPGATSLFSGIGASWSAQPFSALRQRGFYMHVNAEIIFYGGTDPDAKVWVDGKEIKLSPDGSFRYHFTLPDGDFAIPIVGQSPDKVEQRSATFSFLRGTSKSGKVDDTGQPENLKPLIGRR